MITEILALPADEFNAHQVATRMVDNKIEESRQQTWELARQNPNVKNHFNAFANHLRTAYFNGQGFIHEDINRILDATVFAAKKHQFQVRKDSEQTPYIVHPIGVADTLLILGSVRDPDILIAALLHDTVEDTDATFEEIEVLFGTRVRNFVTEVTDDKSLLKPERRRLQIEHAPHKSAGAAQINLADKLYNLRDLSDNPPADWEHERIEHYFRWAETVVNRLPWVNAALKEAVDTTIKNFHNSQASEE